MSDHRPVDPAKLKRQERLEARLRDNLRRRKDAARSGGSQEPVPAEGSDGSNGSGDNGD